MEVIERSTRVQADAARVWQHATSMAGVNRELAPVRMSHPPGMTSLADGDVALGHPLFISVLRLGPVPFDRHQLTLTAIDPGEGFQEDSRSLLHRRWRHRRSITPTDTGCLITDRVEVEPRLPGAGPPTRRVVGRIFDRRHRVLVELYGAP